MSNESGISEHQCIQTKQDSESKSVNVLRLEAAGVTAHRQRGSVLQGLRWCKNKLVSGWREHKVHDQSNPRSWQPAWMRFGPLSGIFTIFVALCSIFASLGILVGSDGSPVDSWSAPPSTYLAIFTALANLAMRYAALQGVIIAWWLRAIQGSTLPKLHWDWRSGTTIRGALTAGKRTGLLALACVFSTIVVADGPLLQRASIVVPAAIVGNPVSLNVSMAHEVPREFSGYWTPNSRLGYSTKAVYSSDGIFNATIPANTHSGRVSNLRHVDVRTSLGSLGGVNMEWYENDPLKGVVRGCPKSQNCRATIRAPALLARPCTNHLLSLDINNTLNKTALYDDVYAPPLDHNLFLIASSLMPGSQEAIDLVTGFGTTDKCEGVFNYSICTLVSAIGEYDVPIRGERIIMEDLKPPRIVAVANNSASGHEWNPTWSGYASTLAGVVANFQDNWAAGLAYWRERNGDIQGVLLSDSENYLNYYEGAQQDWCYSFKDPLSDALLALNNYMFRVGANAAQRSTEWLKPRLDPGLADVVHTTISGKIVGHHPVFQTQYRYFVAATLVELVCIAFVLPTYWGWWRIGRPVSFSPLELAKSFQSPLLDGYNTNSTGRDLASATAGVSVAYGVTSSQCAAEKGQLAFGAVEEVTKPGRGDVFS